jgi:CheY-like chemotaxis protein
MVNRAKVLVVEDNQFARDTINQVLSSLDCEITSAESGEQALSMIKLVAFDVIIMDIKMPGIDGLETFRRAKQIRANLAPVIILTGYPSTEYAVAAGRLEVFHFLAKNPLDGEKLKDTVIKAINWSPEFNNARVKRCFKYKFPGCLYKIPLQLDLVFIGMPLALNDTYQLGIKPVMESFNLKSWFADEDKKTGDISCKICGTLQSCRFAIMDISGLNPNVCIEVGLAYGYGKHVILLKNKQTRAPSYLAGIEYVEYTSTESLKGKLPSYIESALLLDPGAL